MSQMHNWFEAKIQFEKICLEDGLQKKTTETYLIDALSFTEAEAWLVKVVTPYISGEYTVVSIRRAKLYEVFNELHGERWYKAKVLFVVLDHEKGTEKRKPASILIPASDIKEARESLEDAMKGTMSDYEVASITETKIMDVIPYTSED